MHYSTIPPFQKILVSMPEFAGLSLLYISVFLSCVDIYVPSFGVASLRQCRKVMAYVAAMTNLWRGLAIFS